MLRLLLILAFGYLAYRLFKARRSSRFGAIHAARRVNEPEATELVMDPTCKTYLPRDKAIKEMGQYFCSLECRDKYKKLNERVGA